MKFLSLLTLALLVACSTNTPPNTIKGSEVESFSEACSPSGELYNTPSCEDYP